MGISIYRKDACVSANTDAEIRPRSLSGAVPQALLFFLRAKGAYSERGCGSDAARLSPYVEALNIGTAVTLFVAC